ncbi:hypothetical protein COCNU_02G009710 [Cocos nucifera]|uniref:Uncharacterized protein n=1 Tax=Cocos nucifera TaxID=13894 RepID=A0A8K0I030_COCNU|nr:hypothetical protein COCNU_02G009710 [Cocos nucifera]
MEFWDDESDSEDDLQIGQKSNGKLDAKGEQGKSATAKVGNKVDASAAKPKAKMEESVKADKLKAAEDVEDDDDEDDEEDEEDGSDEISDEDEDMAEALGDSDDEDEDEDSEEEDKVTPKKAETGKKRAADSASKTPGLEKKAKIEKTDATQEGSLPTIHRLYCQIQPGIGRSTHSGSFTGTSTFSTSSGGGSGVIQLVDALG